MSLWDSVFGSGVLAAGTGIKSTLEGVGNLAKDIRQAITGEISADKKAEILQKTQELESEILKVQLSVVLAESQSQDKWTSRGRPLFLYVMYIFILAAIPMGVLFAINPQISVNVISGVKMWLQSIPDSMWMLFGSGYLGYGAFRSYDKKNGS